MAQGLSQVVLDGVPPLYAAAQRGDPHEAMVAARRMLTRLREFDPGLAEELKKRLLPAQISGSPLRRAAGPRETFPFANGSARSEPRDQDTHFELLKEIRSSSSRPVVRQDVNAQLDRLIQEHRNPETLARVGLSPRRTVLFVGPPGVGKTMSAAWLAQELSLPLYQLETSALVSSYLGRTGQNLREVFDFGRSNECILLLDEFDAIAKRRDDPADLGEMRRVVSVLLKEIEEWPGPGLLVAATNHPELLDPAVMRRFQLCLNVEPPTAKEASNILSIHLDPLACSGGVHELAASMLEGSSGSHIRDLAHEARRAVALAEASSADEAVLRLLSARAKTQSERKRLARIARAVVRMSFSELATWLDVSKSTIHNYLSDGATE
ncbi:ATP-binding protein [Sorangium sp. So ce429]